MHQAHQDEIDRMFRVSDLLITVHSTLRDRYAVRARAADSVLLAGGALVAAFTFLDPAVAAALLPSRLSASILVGLTGIAVFVASLVQTKMDWSGRSALHARAAEAYLSIKHELGRVKCEPAVAGTDAESSFARVRDRFEGVGLSTVSAPDRLFVRLKQIHRLKIEISKTLDSKPGASILLLRWKLWWRDNVRGGRP